MNPVKAALALCVLCFAGAPHAGEPLRVAAAADLKFCMDEIVTAFRKTQPESAIEVVYGSSGKFQAQIRQGAPFDLYFSADIAFPRELAREGLAASEVRPYAVGRIVLWSTQLDATGLSLADLTGTGIRKIALANPRHAPYGRRAEEALRAAGVWEAVEPRLVYGENIAQAAQFVQSGNAQIGIIALSLALNPELAAQGGYALIPDRLHEPLEQGFVITRRAAGNVLARRFADYIGSAQARGVMARHGFALPGEMTGARP